MSVTARSLTRPLRLMIVDDSNVIRRRIERCQQQASLEVVGLASNGVEAVEVFRRTDPDIVTMDITMPQMDGIECVERLIEIKPGVLILIVSALWPTRRPRSKPWRKAPTDS